ncbi:unnamed protein product [Rotaria magnacalcarata]|uniref:Costars domain-containing protein n=3 Tax=Rotaria magnacalcarata TaxID=392030 RepID=A0A819AWC3_9BILA|nr:unnamed protein product [Rotaria magnacalcarata]CAF1413534.1 unnamed protein product [Rotaria magnacalcarata]CAF2048123.1 unnamed protein product [Rotaria magnacalcarata]CAF2137262.1 unnamed protein product [Rotaria magnacalcarata]CAF2216138.1 unnamed protein product [Rotaria magnacalcarata]
MASPSKDKSMEYDRQMYKKPEKPKNHLAGRVNKFQEKVNQTQAPPPPEITSIHHQPDMDYNILNEIKHVHQLIKDNGQQGDYAIQIKFGELIPIYGSAQIDKLTEVLAIARKNGYINYNLNDFLRQDRDEDIYIKLIKTPY